MLGGRRKSIFLTFIREQPNASAATAGDAARSGKDVKGRLVDRMEIELADDAREEITDDADAGQRIWTTPGSFDEPFRTDVHGVAEILKENGRGRLWQ